MKCKYIKMWIVSVILTVLTACSGSGSCQQPFEKIITNNLILKLTAPNQYPAGVATPITAYLTITNTSDVNASNLYYAIPAESNYTGVTITVANGGSNPCWSVTAYSNCTFPVTIAANAKTGSFTVTATSNGSGTQNSFSRLISKIKSTLNLQNTTLTLTANIGLTNVPPNTNDGTNGISFLYSNTIAANESGETLISVVGIVNSASAGNFNTINLTDQNGNLLNFTVSSGNSGTGASNLTQGSIVTFLLRVPASATGSTFNFYAQTVDNNGGGMINQGNIANPITVGSAASGVLIVQPTNFNLTSPNNESQVVTFTNIGNGPVTNLNIPTPANPLYQISSNCGSTLAAGASCTYILGSHAEPGFSGDTGFTANYNNGTSNVTVASQVHYAGANPVAGILVTSGDNPTLNFVSNTESISKSSQLTLTNSGNVNESNFVFTVPEHFMLTTGISALPCTLSGTTVTSTLAKGASCTLTLTYSNGNVTTSQSANLLVNYKYHGIDAPQSSVPLTYQTVQASGLLQVNPASYTYPNIRANDSMSESNVFIYTNIGTGAANNVSVNSALQIAQGNPTVFHVIPSTPSAANDCGSNLTILAPGATCQVTVQFGPNASGSDGTYTKQLQVNYESIPFAAPVTISATVNGTILPPLSANMVVSNVTITPSALGGNGSADSRFAFESSTPLLVITLSYKNIGNDVAQNLIVDASNPSIGTLLQNNCNNITLPVDGICTVQISYSTVVGDWDLFLDAKYMPLTWSDDRGNVGPMGAQWDNDGVLQDAVYLHVYDAPQVVAMMSYESNGITQITSVNAESDFYVVYTLSGGYNVGNMIYGVNLANAQDGTPPVNIYPSISCTLSGAQPVCAIKLNAGGAAENQVIGYTTTGDLQPVPISSTFDVIGKYAYITNNESNNYTQCNINTNGTIEAGTCKMVTPSGGGQLNIPSGIAFIESFAYIANAGSNAYTQCNVGPLGIRPSTCNTVIPTGSGVLNSPGGIAFNHGYAYIVNVNGNSYTQCEVDNYGVLHVDSCNTITPSGAGVLNMPRSIGFSGSYAYIVNGGDNSYTQCNVATSGIDLNSCSKVTPSGLGALHGPFEVAFNGNYVYFTNGFSNLPENSYTQCSVNNNLIEPSSCNTVTPVSPGALMIPVGIAFSGSYAYIVNHADDAGFPPLGGNYTQCNVNNSGIDSASCDTITLPAGILNLPGGVAIH